MRRRPPKAKTATVDLASQTLAFDGDDMYSTPIQMNAQENTMVVVLKGEGIAIGNSAVTSQRFYTGFAIQPNYGRVQVAHPNEILIQTQPRTAIIFFNLVTIAAIRKLCDLMAKRC